MNIKRKIEEIRKQPEAVRLRYTYVAVGISMFFIILIWVFSLMDTINKAKVDIKKQNVFEDLQAPKKSIKDATEDVKKSLNDLNQNLEKVTPDNDNMQQERSE